MKIYWMCFAIGAILISFITFEISHFAIFILKLAVLIGIGTLMNRHYQTTFGDCFLWTYMTFVVGSIIPAFFISVSDAQLSFNTYTFSNSDFFFDLNPLFKIVDFISSYNLHYYITSLYTGVIYSLITASIIQKK